MRRKTALSRPADYTLIPSVYTNMYITQGYGAVTQYTLAKIRSNSYITLKTCASLNLDFKQKQVKFPNYRYSFSIFYYKEWKESVNIAHWQNINSIVEYFLSLKFLSATEKKNPDKGVGSEGRPKHFLLLLYNLIYYVHHVYVM